MSAAAVMMRRVRTALDYLKEQGATCAADAIDINKVPHHQRWYVRRLVGKEVIVETNGKWHVDEAAASSYFAKRRTIALAAAALFGAYLLWVWLAG